MNTTRILIVDPKPLSALALQRVLAAHAALELILCHTYGDLMDYLEIDQPALVLVQLHGDTMADGIRVGAFCAAAPHHPQVLLVAPRASDGAAVATESCTCGQIPGCDGPGTGGEPKVRQRS